MTLPIESLTSRALSNALDVASLRQQVIATNIANVNTEGYVAQGVSFSTHLAQASGTEGQAQGGLDLQASISPALGSDGQAHGVRLDDEVAQLSMNQVHYQALLKGLNRHLSLLYTAASEGKR
jgi:flagellar basal-body rod protein FlgB